MASEGGAMAGNTALAFGMVCGAGACTSLGAAAAFVVNLEVRARLAASGMVPRQYFGKKGQSGGSRQLRVHATAAASSLRERVWPCRARCGRCWVDMHTNWCDLGGSLLSAFEQAPWLT